jgi:hypothetical protein
MANKNLLLQELNEAFNEITAGDLHQLEKKNFIGNFLYKLSHLHETDPAAYQNFMDDQVKGFMQGLAKSKGLLFPEKNFVIKTHTKNGQKILINFCQHGVIKCPKDKNGNQLVIDSNYSNAEIPLVVSTLRQYVDNNGLRALAVDVVFHPICFLKGLRDDPFKIDLIHLGMTAVQDDLNVILDSKWKLVKSKYKGGIGAKNGLEVVPLPLHVCPEKKDRNDCINNKWSKPVMESPISLVHMLMNQKQNQSGLSLASVNVFGGTLIGGDDLMPHNNAGTNICIISNSSTDENDEENSYCDHKAIISNYAAGNDSRQSKPCMIREISSRKLSNNTAPGPHLINEEGSPVKANTRSKNLCDVANFRSNSSGVDSVNEVLIHKSKSIDTPPNQNVSNHIQEAKPEKLLCEITCWNNRNFDNEDIENENCRRRSKITSIPKESKNQKNNSYDWHSCQKMMTSDCRIFLSPHIKQHHLDDKALSLAFDLSQTSVKSIADIVIEAFKTSLRIYTLCGHCHTFSHPLVSSNYISAKYKRKKKELVIFISYNACDAGDKLQT